MQKARNRVSGCGLFFGDAGTMANAGDARPAVS